MLAKDTKLFIALVSCIRGTLFPFEIKWKGTIDLGSNSFKF